MGFRIQPTDNFVALTENWCLKCNSYVYKIEIDGTEDECWVYGCIECDERLLAIETTNDFKEELRARKAQLYLDRVQEMEDEFFIELNNIEEEAQMSLW